MARLFLILLVALAAPSLAQAQVDISWGSCGGPSHETFACVSNTGHHDLVTSFVSPLELEVIEVTTRVLIQSLPGISFPPWWNFYREYLCREAALFIPDLATSSVSGCSNPFQGATTVSTTIVWEDTVGIQERVARGRVVQRYAEPVHIPANAWLVSNVIRIRNILTQSQIVSCPGCLLETCIVTEGVDLSQAPGAPGPQVLAIRNAAEMPSYVSWQNPTVAGTPCQGPTTTSRTTWGALKAYYR